MTIKYDIEKLKRIVKDIQTLMPVSISISDRDKRMIVEGDNDDEFCSRITSVAEGRARCECSDSDLLRRCSETGAPVSHICHAGILDTVVPITKQGVCAGYIFIGRIRLLRMPEDLADRLSWLGDSIDDIEKRYNKLTYFTEAQMRAMVNLVSSIIFDGAVTVQYDDFIETAGDYISKNLDKNLSVRTLCDNLYVSKNRLYEAFKSQYGKTVNEYIWDCRLNRARELLVETAMSTADIALLIGIENHAYFCKIFKQRVGVSPIRYRRLNSAPPKK